MKDNMDKSLFFMTLSCLCIWLVVDCAVGKNYLGNFLSILFPFMADGTETKSTTLTTKQVETKTNNAPKSSAIGSGKKTTSGNKSTDTGTGINTVPYGATRGGMK